MYPIFAHSGRTLDVLRWADTGTLGYLKFIKDCRTGFDSIVRRNSRNLVGRRLRFFESFGLNLTYYTMNRVREGDLSVDIRANIGLCLRFGKPCDGRYHPKRFRCSLRGF